MSTPERDHDLELRLRRDASTWGGTPSAPARDALRARLATLPRSTLPRSTLPWSTLPWSTLPWSNLPRWPILAASLAAAAALVTVVVLWRAPEPAPAPTKVPAPPQSRAFDVASLEARALAPLRAELAGLARDGELLARGMWQSVPEPMRRLLE